MRHVVRRVAAISLVACRAYAATGTAVTAATTCSIAVSEATTFAAVTAGLEQEQ
jgi:hypothetical protein